MSDRERYKSYLLHLLSDRNADEAGATGGDISGTTASPGGEALRESFRRTLEALAANAHLQYGSRTVEGLAELVADEVADRLDRARQFIDSQNPFRVERDLWNRCSAFDDEAFAAHWVQLRPWLEKRYTDKELSLSFYDAELRSAAPIEYGYVRQEFLSEWDRALMRREITWELEILSRVRQQIEYTAGNRIKGFYGSDFSPVELSLHWSLEPGQWQRQKSDLLQTYAALCRKNPSIHTLLDALGRKGGTRNDKECGYKERYSSSLSRFVRASRSDIEGVGESDRLDALLPTELALLGEPLLERQFYRKYVERRLQTFDFRSHEPVREHAATPHIATAPAGPYIVCLDTSGSMYGKPEEVAKAICYGLLLRSREERRACYLISFSLHVEVLDLADWEGQQARITDFLAHSFCGGTDLTPAIDEALRMLRSDTYRLADVLVISDFELDDFPEKTSAAISEVQSFNVRFHVLQIGRGGNESTLRHFDVRWEYNHRNHRIVQREKSYFTK